MARARNLKPGFFTNELLAECPPLARLLFQGMWCHADREGRLENRPKKLKAEILPYDDCDVPELLRALESRGFTRLYTAGNCQYIQIVNFTKHQNPHPREPKSEIPAEESREKKFLAVENPEPAGPLPSSPVPLPPSPIPHPPPKPPTGGRSVLNGHLEDFELWYAAYPRKVARGAAERAFAKAIKIAAIEDLIAGATRYAKAVSGKEPEFVAHPATWLNGKRWLDGDGISKPRGPKAPPPAYLVEAAERANRERSDG